MKYYIVLAVSIACLALANSAPVQDDEVYIKQSILTAIKELRDKMAATTKEIADIVKEQAIATGTAAKERLAAAKHELTKKLGDLKDQLLFKIREFMIPNDDVPVNYVIDEAFEQIIDNLKEELSDAMSELTDWRNFLSESGREKIRAAKEKMSEVLQKIADAMRRKKDGKPVTTESTQVTVESKMHYIKPANDLWVSPYEIPERFH